MKVSAQGATERALLVACTVTVIYSLIHYWRNLKESNRATRNILIVLRGVVLLLLTAALADVHVEYKSTKPLLVVLRAMSEGKMGNEGTQHQEPSSRLVQNIINSLGEKGIAVEQNLGQQEMPNRLFSAGILIVNENINEKVVDHEVKELSKEMGGAPVYIAVDNERNSDPHVMIEDVTVVGEALHGVTLPVRCVIHGRNMRGRESLVTIADTAKVQTSVNVRWTGDDQRQVVTLMVEPKIIGWNEYVARVEGTSEQTEAFADELARPFTLYAEERRLRVLFFEGEPTWEAKFIRRALEQSELFDIEYYAQVSRAATVGITEGAKAAAAQGHEQANDEAGAKTVTPTIAPQAKLHATLASAMRLNAYDCIIIGATPNDMLSPTEAANLRDWVERRGGGLIVLGGNNFANSIAAPNGKLHALLPVDIDARKFVSDAQTTAQSTPIEVQNARYERIALVPTKAGAASVLRGYAEVTKDAPEKNISLLSGEGLRLSAVRPGAMILAVAGKANNETSETGTPLIASGRDGAGRTLVFAPADSWRIRTSSSDASKEENEGGGAFNQLWQGLVLWAASGARPPVEIGLSDESPAVNSETVAEVRVRDALYAPLKIERMKAQLQRINEEEDESSPAAKAPQEIVFMPDDREPNVWRAQLPLSAPGHYALNINYTAGGKSGNIEKRFGAVKTLSTKGATPDTLMRYARASGGQMFDVAYGQQEALAAQLSAAVQKKSSNNERQPHLWEMRLWWPLAFLIPLLLASEWLLRKVKGIG